MNIKKWGVVAVFILQCSDLHISPETDFEKLRERIVRLGECLKSKIPDDGKLVLCMLGDFVNEGNSDLFPEVKAIIDELKKVLTSILGKDNVSLIMVPGNHDLCEDTSFGKKSLSEFDKFASEIMNKGVNYATGDLIYEYDFFGYHFISICTALKSEYKFGSCDFPLLNRCRFPANTIILMHHALVSGDDDDTSSVRNGYELHRILEEKGVLALLHGHTHGCKQYTVGNNCQIIGVGPMFKPVTDISNQCNLIQINGSRIHRISTFTYQHDRKVWDTIVTYERNENNDYYSNSVNELYNRLLRDAEDDLLLPNLRIQLRMGLSEFEKEMKECFSSCIEVAEEWQSIECPETLTYTHAQLMNLGEKRWEEYVIDTLKRNPTSKRAIVPLIDKTMAFKGGDGKLVAFDIVQFGFTSPESKELYVTVYLRALELRHFFPVNLCEVLLMAKKLQGQIPSIGKVSICIFAFRAEAKRKYGCYRKADIDLLTEADICKLVNQIETGELKKLLLQKSDMGDTVIEEDWLIKVTNAVTSFYNNDNKHAVVQQINRTHFSLLKLKEKRMHSSYYWETQKYEDEFAQSLRNLVDLL